MGQALPKPVETAVLERKGTKQFRCGVAELNGFRNNMEDAHLIHMRETWGFFGVFDGHGGEACSKYVADHLRNKLEESGCPKDDEEVKAFILDTDKAFLDTVQPSGSTAAMCIVHKPKDDSSKHQLRVINAGDSRVLLGRRDGTIVDGGGTDQGLTIDHKPNHPSERERIYRCGGTVEEASGGVHRVNGDLAVSRGFGDAEYKKTGGPGPEDRPVTANPELGHFKCEDSDFMIIVCDGVSEGDFSNQQVVELVAQRLKESDEDNLCEISRAVCHRAIECNSKDNITCMIVLFTPKIDDKPDGVEFIPGAIYNPDSKPFMTAYSAMASKAGKTVEEAAALRYERVQYLLENDAGRLPFEKTEDLQKELETFESLGSPPGTNGSPEREQFFKKWLSEKEQPRNDDLAQSDGPPGDLLNYLRNNPNGQAAMLRQLMDGGFAGGAGVSRGAPPAKGTPVRAEGLATLKAAVTANPKLQWDDRLEKIAGTVGAKVKDDPSDGTSQVTFEKEGFTCWLPTETLIDVDKEGEAICQDVTGAA